ncbi:MAG: PAS domain S-box protein [Bdellovibrionales bacterium]|nr:PAS domain S-box protein [Bdellovibrionales bacterium]
MTSKPLKNFLLLTPLGISLLLVAFASDGLFGDLSNYHLHIWMDAFLGFSYLLIAGALIYFVRAREDVKFTFFFILFSIFNIITAIFHFFDMFSPYWGSPSIDLLVKSLTAVVSVMTSLFVWRSIPFAISVPSPELLDKKNRELLELNIQLEKLAVAKSQDSSQLDSIFNSTGDAILLKNPDGIVINCNKSFTELYGYTKEEIIGRSVKDLVPADKYDQLHKIMSNLRKGKTTYSLETYGIKKDGTRCAISLTVSPIYSSDRKIIGASSIARDISSRIEFEKKLSDNEQLMKTVIQSVTTGILSVSERGVITLTNSSLNNMFGYEPGELIGQKVEVLVPKRYRDSHPIYRQAFWRKPENRQMGAGRELTGVRKDGREFPVEIGLAPIIHERNEVLASVIDISERRFAENYLLQEHDTIKKVLELNTDGWWDWDLRNPKTVYFSPSFKALFGYKDREISNEYASWKQLTFNNEFEEIEKNLQLHLMTDGKHPFHQKIRYKHKDGTSVWTICKGMAFKGESGCFERMIGVHFDISKEIKLDSDLQRTNRELQLRSDEMEQFIYTVSHDLKSPLVTSMSFLNFLREDLEAKKYDEVEDSAIELEKALKQMRSLIHDILEVSRLGTVKLLREPVNLTHLIDNIVQKFMDNDSTIPTRITVQRNMGAVEGDPKRLSALFENLITNASKYNKRKDVKEKTIDVFSEIKNQEYRICVRDNGPGIHAKFHTKIFELFHRLDTKVEGTGVGLAIVAKVAEQHDGTAWVESEPGRGSSFWVSLPMTRKVTIGNDDAVNKRIRNTENLAH